MASEWEGRNRRTARYNLGFNVLLTVVKVAAGVLGRSSALIADGVHSGADVLASLAVVIGLAGAGRPPDAGHHYGHEKAEAISQNVVAIFLLLAGLELANSAIAGLKGRVTLPAWWTLVIAMVVMVPKAVIAVSQRRVARRTGSHGILASAVDNQMDAVASLVAGAGIAASRLGFPQGDNVAALLVAGLVIWAGIEVFRTASNDLMDPAADAVTETAICRQALAVNGVLRVTSLRTRVHGSGVLADLEVEVDRHLSLVQAHDIAHAVESQVTKLERVKGTTVHVNPSQEGDRR